MFTEEMMENIKNLYLIKEKRRRKLEKFKKLTDFPIPDLPYFNPFPLASTGAIRGLLRGLRRFTARSPERTFDYDLSPNTSGIQEDSISPSKTFAAIEKPKKLALMPQEPPRKGLM